MELDPPHTTPTPDQEETRRRLTSEVGEVESAIELVASGSASRITLTGLRFGEAVGDRFREEAGAKGVQIDALPWPDDAGCDLIVRRIDG
jgi:hypothetical protein